MGLSQRKKHRPWLVLKENSDQMKLTDRLAKSHHPVCQRFSRKVRFVVLGSALNGLILSALTGCGSEKDEDLRDKIKKEEKKTAEPARESSETEKPRIVIGQESSDATAIDPRHCAADMTLQVVLNPEDTSNTQSLLTARLPPECFVNSSPVMRLRITSTFRIGVPLQCEPQNVGDYNFECTGAVEQFVADDQVTLPVEYSSEGDLLGFKAEIEFVLPEPPSPIESPDETVLNP